MKRAQIRSSTLEIINMRTMNRAQLDKLISDHFMYEVIDDVEGVCGHLRTTYAEHELVDGWMALCGKAALGSFYARLFPDLKGEVSSRCGASMETISYSL
jgi:hypothetical protein